MKKREFLKSGLLSFSAMTLSPKLSALEYYPNVCGNRMQPPGPEQTSALIDNHLAILCGVSNTVPSKVFLGRITYQ